jgi:hypothetical protein
MRELDPDVVLMEIWMPGTDGVAAARRLIRLGVCARVLILTTYHADRFVYEGCGPALGVPSEDNAAGPACQGPRLALPLGHSADRQHGVRGLGPGRHRLRIGRLSCPQTDIFFAYFQRSQARGGRMPGQNGSTSGRGGSSMERLWIREIRRAARRASAPFARQLALGCGAAAVGTMAASVVPPPWDRAVAQAVWAALWAVAGYLAIWTGLFIYHLSRYRSSGFRDNDWIARHDDSDPGGALFLELVRRSGGSPNPGVDLELCVKSHGNWVVVDDDEVVLMPDRVIRCRFDFSHEVFPGGFYDVRWYRADDRGKFAEITRERFQLRNHAVGPRRGPVSRTGPGLAPEAPPPSEDEVKPRRAVEVR